MQTVPCVVLDVFSRRVVGWAIDSHQATSLVTNALSMAIYHRNPLPDPMVIGSDHGSQYTSWEGHPSPDQAPPFTSLRQCGPEGRLSAFVRCIPDILATTALSAAIWPKPGTLVRSFKMQDGRTTTACVGGRGWLLADCRRWATRRIRR
jgi:hypothetical protein